jgi:hypothetical protein
MGLFRRDPKVYCRSPSFDPLLLSCCTPFPPEMAYFSGFGSLESYQSLHVAATLTCALDTLCIQKTSSLLIMVYLSLFCTLHLHGAQRMYCTAPHCLSPSSKNLSTGLLARNVLKIHQSNS